MTPWYQVSAEESSGYSERSSQVMESMVVNMDGIGTHYPELSRMKNYISVVCGIVTGEPGLQPGYPRPPLDIQRGRDVR